MVDARWCRYAGCGESDGPVFKESSVSCREEAGGRPAVAEGAMLASVGGGGGSC